MRHFGEDEGRAASQREEARLCGLGTKCARDEAVPEVGAWTTTTTEVVLDQIWVRARTTVADLDLRVALGRERCELAGPPAETAREVHVCGGGAGGDEEQWRRGGSRRRTRDDGGGKR